MKLRDIHYPVFSGINDSPQAPNEQQGGNGADFIKRFNDLVRAIAPVIKLDLSNVESDLGETSLDNVNFLFLPVPFSYYDHNKETTPWAITRSETDLTFGSTDELIIDEFNGLNNVFTFVFSAGGGYGGTNPLDDVGFEVLEIEGKASFVDLPKVYDPFSGSTWNNLVGIYPFDPSLKIKLRPSTVKPTTGELIGASSFQLT